MNLKNWKTQKSNKNNQDATLSFTVQIWSESEDKFIQDWKKNWAINKYWLKNLQNSVFYYSKMLVITSDMLVSRGQNQKKYWCINGISGKTYPQEYVHVSVLF